MIIMSRVRRSWITHFKAGTSKQRETEALLKQTVIDVFPGTVNILTRNLSFSVEINALFGQFSKCSVYWLGGSSEHLGFFIPTGLWARRSYKHCRLNTKLEISCYFQVIFLWFMCCCNSDANLPFTVQFGCDWVQPLPALRGISVGLSILHAFCEEQIGYI